MRAWMLLLVVGMVGCGETPAPVAAPEPVAGEAKQSPIVPELGQDAIIAEIEKLGGEVEYDEKSPERPIVAVGVYGTEVTDAHVVHLKGLTSLQSLYLGNTQVTDAGVNELQKALPNCQIVH